MVAAAVSSVPVRNTVDDGAAGADMVAAVGGALQTTFSAAFRIVPC